jgi:exopolyphosphatase/guanosine-5'-triphosphate,3'-diphosphate pyrophosphatase
MPRTVNTIRSEGIKLAYGSSGTIINLAEISEKMSKKQVSKRNLVLKHKDLEKVVSKLCSLTLDERKKIPGINPERADIIIGGAAIIETLMEQFKLDKITVSERGLIHGMLIDYLSRHEGFAELNEMSVREMSVLMLGRSCNLNEKHANFVTSLAMQLFDSSMKIKLHSLGEEERELLKYASFLHDIGDFISFSDHPLHSAYIVSNAELLGFKQSEINIMANVVRFHGKKLPVREDSSTAEFDDGYNTISVLSMLLKLAENLDRSRTGIIKNAEFKLEGGDKVILSLVSAGDCQLEIWGVNENLEAFGDVFKKKIELEIKNIR